MHGIFIVFDFSVEEEKKNVFMVQILLGIKLNNLKIKMDISIHSRFDTDK